MKDLKTWAIIGLALIIVLMVLFRKPAERTDLTPYKTALAISDQKIQQLTTDSVKLAEKIKSDSIDQTNERLEHQRKDEKKSREIARLRANPKVVEVLAASPETDSLVTALEERNDLLETRVDTLERNLSGLRIDMKKVNDNCAGLLAEERTKNTNLEEINKLNEKALKKKTRGNRLAKAGAVVLGVGGFLLGSQL